MNNALHIDCAGNGKPLVLLHGWGMHAGLFTPLIEPLAHRHLVLAVDLPGHGLSEEFAGFDDLSSHAELLLHNIRRITTEKFTLVGWSLGSLLAQYLAANHSQHVARLVLFAGTPCFPRQTDWQFGIDNAALTRFADELLGDFRTTLSRFLALQFFGAEQQRENLRSARELVFARPNPRPATLRQGLRLLETTDLREQLGMITCPTLLMNGERDTLVPAATTRFMAEQLPNGRCVLVKGAGHAAFLSHTYLFKQYLQRFLKHD